MRLDFGRKIVQDKAFYAEVDVEAVRILALAVVTPSRRLMSGQGGGRPAEIRPVSGGEMPGLWARGVESGDCGRWKGRKYRRKYRRKSTTAVAPDSDCWCWEND